MDQEARELRRKNHVVRDIFVLVAAVHHRVLLAVVDIDAFEVKPVFLLGREWAH